MVAMPSNIAFISSSFFIETNTQTFESPINRKTQRIELTGQRWRATWTLPAMSKTNAALWIAFFMKLKGRVNTITASDPDWQTNTGEMVNSLGSPLVNGASQTGNSLIIDGASINITNWGKAGDYFNVNSKLYRLTAACSTNGTGQTTLVFEPPIYVAPADNAVIGVHPATVEMMLLDDNVLEWNSGHGYVYDQKTFSAVEVL